MIVNPLEMTIRDCVVMNMHATQMVRGLRADDTGEFAVHHIAQALLDSASAKVRVE